ncbi:MAG: HisA/HisF-related TIM barrel protein [Candidatus Parvarchaeota archaeon]|nr:HisA/HisF-related TIM barrel protein [Candidatus Jingweiarchaeum tengchongense]
MLKNEYNKNFLKKHVEFWIGCTKESGFEVMKWARKLKEERLSPIILFPGRIMQGILAYDYVDKIMAPILLNYSFNFTYIRSLIGRFIVKSSEKTINFGYLIFGPFSRVGKKVGAKKISKEKVLEIIKKFRLRKDSNVLYLEAGSGAKKPVDYNIVKRARRMLKRCVLIVGGGIRNPSQVRKFFKCGSDKVVLSTVLEKKEPTKILKLMKKFIKCVE